MRDPDYVAAMWPSESRLEVVATSAGAEVDGDELVLSVDRARALFSRP